MPNVAILDGRKFRVDRKTGKAIIEAAEACAAETRNVRNSCQQRSIERRPGALRYGFLDDCDISISRMAEACSIDGSIRGLAVPPRRRKAELKRVIRRPKGRPIRIPKIKEPLRFPQDAIRQGPMPFAMRIPRREEELPDFPAFSEEFADVYDELEIDDSDLEV